MSIPNKPPAQQENMSSNEKPIVLFVAFEFQSKDMPLAIDLLTEMQKQTLENEEGCIAYHILLNDEEPYTIYLHECYKNSNALDIHNKAAYFDEIVNEKLAPIIKERKILKLNPLNNIGAKKQ